MPMIEVEENQIVIDEWTGCYGGGWKGVICDDAFAHPAKVAFNLARRIYEHAIEEGWIKHGDTVVDPFGGIGGCAFHGLINGMRVVTCELEEKFVNLSKENRELWRAKFTGLPGFDADNWTILQGDSRKLASVIREAGLSVSSPPYAAQDLGGGDGQRKMSGSFSAAENKATKDGKGLHGNYGQSEGQLGAMREGDLTLAVSSPPYAVVSPEKSSRSVDYAKQYETYRSQGGGASFEKFVATQELHSQGYGSSAGQLASLPVGDINLAVTSPPFSQPETRDRAPVQEGSISDAMTRAYTVDRQSQTDGNLAALNLEGFQAAISAYSRVEVRYNGADAKEFQNQPSAAGCGDRADVQLRSDELPDSRPTKDKPQFDSNTSETCGSNADEQRGGDNGLSSRNPHAAKLLERQEAATGDGRETSGENPRRKSSRVEGRQRSSRVSQTQKAAMRTVSSNKESSCASQGLGSFQQRSEQSSDSVQELSPQTPQANVLGREETRSGTPEVECPDSLVADICVSSPPYEGSLDNILPRSEDGKDNGAVATFRRPGEWPERRPKGLDYGTSDGQIGKETGDTFWSASRTILEQLYSVLTPGAHAIFIVKAFVRNKQIVDFPGQWAQLCEAVGFKLIHDHHALLTEHSGTQGGMFGEDKEIKVKRVSFFRRLHEKRAPETEIFWENVLCFIRS